MKSSSDIITIAEAKIQAAECLADNEIYAEAFYIGGYAVELLLKAKICKTLNVDDFFLFDPTKAKPEVYKPFKSHDYKQLILLSGLYNSFEIELFDSDFKFSWSKICEWRENSRYEMGNNGDEIKFFLISIKKVCKWIKKHL